MPVPRFVAYPPKLVEGVRTEYVFTGVADTVVVSVIVKSKILVAYVTATGYVVPMRRLVRVPDIHIVCMLACYVCTNVTDTVLVFVRMSALYVGAALITLEISGIYVNVIYTFEVFVTSVTFEVFVHIIVHRAGKNEVAGVANVVLVIFVGMLAVYADTALIALGVAVHINVLIAGDGSAAEIASAVSVLVRVSRTGKNLSANVADKIFRCDVDVFVARYRCSAEIANRIFVCQVAVYVRRAFKSGVTVVAFEVSVSICMLGTSIAACTSKKRKAQSDHK